MHVLRYGAESRKPSQCIKIGNACIKICSQCIKIGNACIKIWNAHFRHCATIFGTVRFFRKFFLNFFQGPRAYNYYACGYFITRADILSRTVCSNLTVAMQKKKWRKFCSKCCRLRYTYHIWKDRP